jgi:hypothetical protein
LPTRARLVFFYTREVFQKGNVPFKKNILSVHFRINRRWCDHVSTLATHINFSFGRGAVLFVDKSVIEMFASTRGGNNHRGFSKLIVKGL